MPDTNSTASAELAVIASLHRRIALPFFLFSSFLFGFLIISLVVILPRWSMVTVDGHSYHVSQLPVLTATLLSNVASAEQKRDDILLPTHDKAYLFLREQKRQEFSVLGGMDMLSNLAKAVAPTPNSILLTGFTYTGAKKIFIVSGDVRSVGPRSMTLLAQFIESVRQLPFVTSLDDPHYTRVDDPGIGPHSPFTFTIHLP